jgi:hypothetical protein
MPVARTGHVHRQIEIGTLVRASARTASENDDILDSPLGFDQADERGEFLALAWGKVDGELNLWGHAAILLRREAEDCR